MEGPIVLVAVVLLILLGIWINRWAVKRPTIISNPPRTRRVGRPFYLRDDISHHKRAQEYGVPFEAISLTSVFNRDRWTCGICYGQIDPNVLYPDPLTPSLDHIVPLSRPGSPGHVVENVQASHLRCNLRKGDR